MAVCNINILKAHLFWPINFTSRNFPTGASLVAQWLRIHLPMQGTWVWALVREDPTCHRATKPEHHNYWACTLEPASHNYWACTLEPTSQLLSLRATTTEARVPRARAPQQEKSSQWEAHAPQWRVTPLTTTRESPRTATKTHHRQK